METNWNLQEGFLQINNLTVLGFQCAPTEYNCYNITINENEILRTRLPTNMSTDGICYIPKMEINEHCFIPETVTNVSMDKLL